MDSPLRFGRGHPLNTMNAAFKMQPLVGALTRDFESNFLYPANAGVVLTQDFQFPLAGLCVPLVHPKNLSCEQTCLVATGPGSHLDNGIGEFSLVFRQQFQADFSGKRVESLLKFLDFDLRHFENFSVVLSGQHFPRAFHVGLRARYVVPEFYDMLELAVFATEPSNGVGVRRDFGLRHQPFNLAVTVGDFLQAVFHRLLHSLRLPVTSKKA